MSRPSATRIASLGSSELDAYLASIGGLAKVLLVLAGLALTPELLRGGGARPWMIALIVALAALGYHAYWRYRAHPGSVRALLWMMDAVTLSLTGLLPLALLLMAQNWAKNFALYGRYWPAYTGAAVLVFVWVMFLRGAAHRRGLEQQIDLLRAAAERGRLGAQQFYDILMVVPGARGAVQSWGAARYGAIIGPLVVGFMVLSATGGRDGMIFGAFLLVAAAGVPLLLASVILRRISVVRGLGARDIELVADGGA